MSVLISMLNTIDWYSRRVNQSMVFPSPALVVGSKRRRGGGGGGGGGIIAPLFAVLVVAVTVILLVGISSVHSHHLAGEEDESGGAKTNHSSSDSNKRRRSGRYSNSLPIPILRGINKVGGMREGGNGSAATMKKRAEEENERTKEDSTNRSESQHQSEAHNTAPERALFDRLLQRFQHLKQLEADEVRMLEETKLVEKGASGDEENDHSSIKSPPYVSAWAALPLYFPLSAEAIAGFAFQEEKQKTKRDPRLVFAWVEGKEWDNGEECSREVPECDFFLLAAGAAEGRGGSDELVHPSHFNTRYSSSPPSSEKKAKKKPLFPTLRAKCCAEHQKLKHTLFYTIEVIELYNAWVQMIMTTKQMATSEFNESTTSGGVGTVDPLFLSPRHLFEAKRSIYASSLTSTTMSVNTTTNNDNLLLLRPPAPIVAFLDSGTLIGAVRDGGGGGDVGSRQKLKLSDDHQTNTYGKGSGYLVPWDTDIDVGVIGSDGDDLLRAFTDGFKLDGKATVASSSQAAASLEALPSLRSDGAVASSSVYSAGHKRGGEWIGMGEAARRKLLPETVPRSELLAILESLMEKQMPRTAATSSSSSTSASLPFPSSVFELLFPTYSRLFVQKQKRQQRFSVTSKAGAHDDAVESKADKKGAISSFSPPRHYFEHCLTKQRKKTAEGVGQKQPASASDVDSIVDAINQRYLDVDDHFADVVCKDAHYVYFVGNKSMFHESTTSSGGGRKASSALPPMDTSHVELYPFAVYASPSPSSSSSSSSLFLKHPTRPYLNMPLEWVVGRQLRNNDNKEEEEEEERGKGSGGSDVSAFDNHRFCALWGRPMPCPHDPVAYLDHIYTNNNKDGHGGGWRTPQTIHWGERNVQKWK